MLRPFSSVLDVSPSFAGRMRDESDAAKSAAVWASRISSLGQPDELVGDRVGGDRDMEMLRA